MSVPLTEIHEMTYSNARSFDLRCLRLSFGSIGSIRSLDTDIAPIKIRFLKDN
jgi:hypothetical protein